MGEPARQSDKLGRRIATARTAYLSPPSPTGGPSTWAPWQTVAHQLTLDAVRPCPELIPMMFDS
jgi:hypothetical protein